VLFNFVCIGGLNKSGAKVGKSFRHAKYLADFFSGRGEGEKFFERGKRSF
jgi:hypothetical protein